MNDEEKVIEPSEIIVETQEEKIKKANYKKINPWVRFLARFTDYSLLNLMIIFLRFLLSGYFSLKHFEYILPVEFLFWVPIEAFLLSRWGFTPGKFLLRTKVQTRFGKKIDFSKALHRSFSVWVKGIGLGIPIISIFAMLYNYFRLKVEGITSWDKQEHTRVVHEPMPRGQMLISAAIIFLSVFLTCLFSK